MCKRPYASWTEEDLFKGGKLAARCRIHCECVLGSRGSVQEGCSLPRSLEMDVQMHRQSSLCSSVAKVKLPSFAFYAIKVTSLLANATAFKVVFPSSII